MFKLRTISTLIAIPIVVLVVWLGTPWMTILAMAWGAGAVNEFYGIVAKSRGLSPLTYFGIFWVMLLIGCPNLSRISQIRDLQPLSILLTTAIIFPLVFLLFRKGKETAFANWAWTIAGILYIGWLLSYYIALRDLNDYGMGWVFLALLCTFASDIGAYLIGRSFGRHKMAPYISPNKTWEGAVGGLAGAIIISAAVVYLFKLPIGYIAAVILGLAVGLIGQLGDLVKSLFKRNMTIKDSGNVLPGHGGFLDRMDSLAFAGVTVYYFVIFFSATV
jgi:phosphatidate cytidylyltransferase